MLTPGVCYCCKSALVPTSRGVLAAWRHVYAGNMRDIAFSWLARPGGRAIAGPTRVTRMAGRSTAARMTARRWPPARRPRAHRVAHGDSRRRADGRPLLCRHRRRRCGSRAQRVPTLGAPKPSHPQVAVDGTGRLFVAWDEVLERRAHAPLRSSPTSGDGGTLRFAPAPAAHRYPVAPLRRSSRSWHVLPRRPLRDGVRRRARRRPRQPRALGHVAAAHLRVRRRRTSRCARSAARRRSHGAPLRRSGTLRQVLRRSGARPVADADTRHRGADLTPGQAVADIGAGTGYFSVRLALSATPTVFAVDLEPTMVEHLTNRAKAEHLATCTRCRPRRRVPTFPSRSTSCSSSTPTITSAIARRIFQR